MKLIVVAAYLFILASSSQILEAQSTDDKIDYSQPILPDIYQKLIGPGFNVKYFTSGSAGNLLKNYQDKNIEDMYKAGFRNAQLRCCASCFPYPYDSSNFTDFLNALEIVVDRCLEVGIIPIVTWAHGAAVGRSTEEDRLNYLNWWRQVGEKLKRKDYRLSYKLATEFIVGSCRDFDTCDQSIAKNRTNYNLWMSQVRDTIRETGGKNKKRIIIPVSPQKDARPLKYIDSALYENDTYLMVEWHSYAAGPTGNVNSSRLWEGCGNATHRQRLIDDIETAKRNTPLLQYYGEWMSYDNKRGLLDQYELECFAEFFVSTLKKNCIPWTLNNFEHFYWTHNSSWRYELQQRPSKYGPMLNMSRILDVIKRNMPIFNTTYLSDLPTCPEEKK